MSWGDHERSERRIDEQMKQAQGQLAQQQQNIANQSGAYNNVMWGQGGAPQVGNTYGYGSTVPHFSQQGSYFQGNGTDTPSPLGGYQQGGQVGGQQQPQGQLTEQDYTNYQNQFNQLFPGETVSSEMLMANKDRLAQMGMEVQTNASGRAGKIKLPNGDIIDVVGGGEHGANIKTWQYGPGSPMQTGNFAGGPIQGGDSGFGGGGVVGRNLADYGNIMGRYENFADTGGYSDQDLSNIRSRALSPIRSIYSTAQQKMEQQRALQGGYSPGFATAMSRFGREQGQLTSDAATNAEAAIAEMRQKGKLAGMGGMASMYGSTPGLSNMFGNQALQSQAQGLQGAQLQNQLSLGLIGAQNQLGANVRGNLDSAINTGLGASQIVGNVGNAISAWPDEPGWGPGGINPGTGADGPGEVWGDGIEGTPMQGQSVRTDMGAGPFGGYTGQQIPNANSGRMIGGGSGMSPEGNTYNSSQNDSYRNQPYYGSGVPGYKPTAGNW